MEGASGLRKEWGVCAQGACTKGVGGEAADVARVVLRRPASREGVRMEEEAD